MLTAGFYPKPTKTYCRAWDPRMVFFNKHALKFRQHNSRIHPETESLAILIWKSYPSLPAPCLANPCPPREW